MEGKRVSLKRPPRFDLSDQLTGLVVHPDLVFAGDADDDVAVVQHRQPDRSVQVLDLKEDAELAIEA